MPAVSVAFHDLGMSIIPFFLFSFSFHNHLKNIGKNMGNADEVESNCQSAIVIQIPCSAKTIIKLATTL